MGSTFCTPKSAIRKASGGCPAAWGDIVRLVKLNAFASHPASAPTRTLRGVSRLSHVRLGGAVARAAHCCEAPPCCAELACCAVLPCCAVLRRAAVLRRVAVLRRAVFRARRSPVGTVSRRECERCAGSAHTARTSCRQGSVGRAGAYRLMHIHIELLARSLASSPDDRSGDRPGQTSQTRWRL